MPAGVWFPLRNAADMLFCSFGGFSQASLLTSLLLLFLSVSLGLSPPPPPLRFSFQFLPFQHNTDTKSPHRAIPIQSRRIPAGMLASLEVRDAFNSRAKARGLHRLHGLGLVLGLWFDSHIIPCPDAGNVIVKYGDSFRVSS